MKDYQYQVRISETGTVIDEVSTIERAESIIRDYEKEDKESGNYCYGEYEIYDTIYKEII